MGTNLTGHSAGFREVKVLGVTGRAGAERNSQT